MAGAADEGKVFAVLSGHAHGHRRRTRGIVVYDLGRKELGLEEAEDSSERRQVGLGQIAVYRW